MEETCVSPGEACRRTSPPSATHRAALRLEAVGLTYRLGFCIAAADVNRTCASLEILNDA